MHRYGVALDCAHSWKRLPQSSRAHGTTQRRFYTLTASRSSDVTTAILTSRIAKNRQCSLARNFVQHRCNGSLHFARQCHAATRKSPVSLVGPSGYSSLIHDRSDRSAGFSKANRYASFSQAPPNMHEQNGHSTGTNGAASATNGQRQQHRAIIAFGSNIGDRVQHIESALKMMKAQGLVLRAVSRLYATKAMYYENQDPFLNGVCEVGTFLEPIELLDCLQGIETALGRKRTIDKGPRTLDLDVIMYDDQKIQTERLEVPHPRVLEREFVLRPLNDIQSDLFNFETLHRLLSTNNVQQGMIEPSILLKALQDPSAPMFAQTVLRNNSTYLQTDDTTRRTLIMGILNITPDSFSDGGQLYSDCGVERAVALARQFVAEGADILDIGGQSTRPGAEYLTAEQELKRVLPIVQAIRSTPEIADTTISIDTFHAPVAEATILEGADIINDVSGGTMDPDMLATVAKYNKTIVLMHMRGTPQTMTRLTQYPHGVLTGVAEELKVVLQKAYEVGILPWRIVLDPGIGFAKTQHGNLQLLAQGGQLRQPQYGLSGLPWLYGTSRKGFIGKVTEVKEAKDRLMGTAAGVTASVASGADIVRVHDVKEMVQVCKMADAMYRQDV